MVHWVFSTFGKHPIVSRSNSRKQNRTPPPAPAEATRQIVKQEEPDQIEIQSPKTESKRDSDLNSHRASAGSSTLNTRPSRAHTAESSYTSSHNLRGLGNVAAPTPATFYAKEALEGPTRDGSIDLGAGNEPRPSWPLPESILTGSASASIASIPIDPIARLSPGHCRSLSNSSRQYAGCTRMESSNDLKRPSSQRTMKSQEPVRTHSRAGTLSPFPLANLAEVTDPSSALSSGELPQPHRAPGEIQSTALSGEPIAARGISERPVQDRTSSLRAPTITSKSTNLRDVDTSKMKGKSASNLRGLNARGSRQSDPSFLSPRETISRPPGSRSRDSDATALPRFLFDQSNLEEQLEAARIFQANTPPLSVASTRSHAASRLATEIYTLSYLIFFSILGTLARIGLASLTFYPGAPAAISGLWSNFAGSFLLGFIAEDRRLFREEWGSHKPDTPSFDVKNREITSPTSEKFYFANRRGHRDEDHPSQVVSHGRVKRTIPLFIGLATGFCGSFTSFSSFMRDGFFALANELPTPISHTYPQGFTTPNPADTIPRNAGYSVMAVMAIVLLTVCMSIGALRFGAHFAISLDLYLPTFRFQMLRRFIDPTFVFLGWGTWVGAVIMCIWPPDRPSGPQSIDGTWASETWRGQALFACAFAPVGCLIRFYVSVFLNTLSVSFPLGTFAVNIFGTAVEGMAFDLQHIRINTMIGGGHVSCQVLQGVQDGFCGSLTVVSAWAAELNGLRRHHAYVYGITSIICGLGLMVAIIGSVLWTAGWSQPVCSA